jgi:hypothetical protein
MSQFSVPQQGVLVGDASRAPYDAYEWAYDHDAALLGFASRANYGVILGVDNGSNFSLEVTQTTVASNQVELKIGAAVVRGVVYQNDATLAFTVQPNASGNPRIDTLVLRLDYIAQTIRAAIKQGTPAATPAPPALLQTVGTEWEIPIADITVANGFSTISDSNITGRHEFVNVGDGVFNDGVLNDSGATLEDGDVVIWKPGTARAVTTTTTVNHWRIAGVWRGRTANGARGRIQTGGLGKVKLFIQNLSISSQTVPVGMPLVSGSLVKYGTVVDLRASGRAFKGTDPGTTTTGARTGSARAPLGYLMQSIAIIGSSNFLAPALAYIDVKERLNAHSAIYKSKGTTDAGTFTSGSWVARGFNRVSHGDTLDVTMSVGNNNRDNNYVSFDGTSFTLQPGRYRIRGYSAGYRVDGHLVRWQDTTNAATIVVSRPAYSPSAADSSQSYAEFETFLVIEAATAYQYQARCTTTRATDGLGKYVGFSSEEVTFAFLDITRIDEVYT